MTPEEYLISKLEQFIETKIKYETSISPYDRKSILEADREMLLMALTNYKNDHGG